MHFILGFLKYFFLTLVTICCLCVFLFVGGLWFAESQRGYVVIYKYPHALQKVTDVGGDAVQDARLEQDAWKVLAVRETGGFRDIIIIGYVCLIIGLLGLAVLISALVGRKKRRYFKSSRKIEAKLRL